MTPDAAPHSNQAPARAWQHDDPEADDALAMLVLAGEIDSTPVCWTMNCDSRTAVCNVNRFPSSQAARTGLWLRLSRTMKLPPCLPISSTHVVLGYLRSSAYERRAFREEQTLLLAVSRDLDRANFVREARCTWHGPPQRRAPPWNRRLEAVACRSPDLPPPARAVRPRGCSMCEPSQHRTNPIQHRVDRGEVGGRDAAARLRDAQRRG